MLIVHYYYLSYNYSKIVHRVQPKNEETDLYVGLSIITNP